MKRQLNYRYKMEKVLEYRENIEKSKVEDLTRITHKLDREKEILETLKEALDARKKESLSGTGAMKMQFLYKEKLKTEVTRQSGIVEDFLRKADAARDILIEARKDRKIMEMLKEKDKEKFEQEMQLKEQKELDDFSVMRFAR